METLALIVTEIVVFGTESIIITALIVTLALTVHQWISRSTGKPAATIASEGALQ